MTKLGRPFFREVVVLTETGREKAIFLHFVLCGAFCILDRGICSLPTPEKKYNSEMTQMAN